MPLWTSRFAFLMAAIGSAVGLGNLWRFPFQTGEQGGSAFVIVYLFCITFVAYPILMGELAIGRHGRRSAVGSTTQLAKEAGRSPAWGLAGWVGVTGCFCIFTTYSVIAGQVMAYAAMSSMGEFAGRTAVDAAAITPLYDGPGHALLWHTLFMALTVAVVAQGLHNGIERLVTILMPAFFVMLAGLSVYAMLSGGAEAALVYLFAPRFSEISPSVILAALGQAFFSIGIGAGLMLTYGAFLNAEENIGQASAIIAGADTAVAVVAGLMIFPIVFSHGLDPAAGTGLIFGALPAVFAGMPFGSLVGGLFFFLAFVAALTSSISILLTLSAVAEEQFLVTRTAATLGWGAVVWSIGAATIVVSGFGDWIDFVGGSIALPVGGLLVAMLAGWVAPRTAMRGEMTSTAAALFSAWRLMIRYVAPLAVLLILLFGLDAKFGFGLSQMMARD
jgi:neurotransmitter:Na+ symporter, NSS family